MIHGALTETILKDTFRVDNRTRNANTMLQQRTSKLARGLRDQWEQKERDDDSIQAKGLKKSKREGGLEQPK